jgi:hypothetical protein
MGPGCITWDNLGAVFKLASSERMRFGYLRPNSKSGYHHLRKHQDVGRFLSQDKHYKLYVFSRGVACVRSLFDR